MKNKIVKLKDSIVRVLDEVDDLVVCGKKLIE